MTPMPDRPARPSRAHASTRAVSTRPGCASASWSRASTDIISTQLLDGAVEALRHHGVGAGDIEVVWVPGAFEIPIAARELAQLGGVDAVVCLGAVIRGDTPHFDYVAGEAARGIASVHATTGVPATFGVLTVDTVEQARDRAGGKHGNKGAEAADAAIEMAVVAARPARGQRTAEHRAAS